MSAQAAVHVLHDAEPVIGVARCPEGDREKFAKLAEELLDMLGFERDTPLREPVWRWFRMNPCSDGEYAWRLGYPSGPGRGRWMGAEVILK